MTRHLAFNYASQNVRVNAIAPGYIVTPGSAPLLENEELTDQLLALTPMGRMGEHEEAAAVAAFLASDDASFITGVTLNVDGGYTIR